MFGCCFFCQKKVFWLLLIDVKTGMLGWVFCCRNELVIWVFLLLAKYGLVASYLGFFFFMFIVYSYFLFGSLFYCIFLYIDFFGSLFLMCFFIMSIKHDDVYLNILVDLLKTNDEIQEDKNTCTWLNTMGTC